VCLAAGLHLDITDERWTFQPPLPNPLSRKRENPDYNTDIMCDKITNINIIIIIIRMGMTQVIF